MSTSKEPLNLALILASQITAVYTSYQVNSLTGLAPALLVLPVSSMLFYNLSSSERVWNTFSMLINPIQSGMLLFAVGIIYFALKGFKLPELLLAGLASLLVGSALGIFFFTYWSIGD